MAVKSRRRSPRVPEFKPWTELVAGDPFNPFKVFTRPSLIRALGAYKKISASARWVWWVLADQCSFSNYDRHSQANLAEMAGVSRPQFQRHLDHLARRKLVAVSHDLGRANRVWMLFHPAFALCSPLPSITSEAPPTSEVMQGVPQKRGTHGSSSRSLSTVEGVTRQKATSDSGKRAAFAENHPPKPSSEDGNGDVPITASPETLTIKLDHRFPWHTFNSTQKQIRINQLASLAEQADHYRQHINHKDASIARSARHELERTITEMTQLGAFVPHTNSKGRK